LLLWNIMYEIIDFWAKEFRWAVRIEVVRQKEIEKVNIMEARSNNMELFHKLIQNNRKKGLEHI
jgi:hypothetical protein